MLYVFLYISELLVSVLIIFRVYKRSVGRYSPQFKAKRRRANISWRSALPSLWWVKILLIRQAFRLVCVHLLCSTPLLKFKTLVSCIRFFTCFLCGCSLVRVTTRWRMLMVAPISISYASVRVFPMGFLVLSSPVLSLHSRSSRFATLGRGGSGEFRGILFLARCPLGHILIVSCCVPFSCVGGGGEKKYYYL